MKIDLYQGRRVPVSQETAFEAAPTQRVGAL